MDTTVATSARSNLVQWAPIFGGAVAASAISFVLMTAGAAVGLATGPSIGNHTSGRTVVYLTAFWALAVPILALLVGGYIAGRMRSRSESASADEVTFRDGVHGLLVWSTSVVIGVMLAASVAGSAINAGAMGAQRAAANGPLIESTVDSLLRQSGNATTTQPIGGLPAETRQEVGRIVVAAIAAGSLDPADRSYLAQVISQRTGVSAADAEKRIDETYAKAVKGANDARKATVAAAMLAVTALLVSLVAAWFAARSGGAHRDANSSPRLRWEQTPLR